MNTSQKKQLTKKLIQLSKKSQQLLKDKQFISSLPQQFKQFLKQRNIDTDQLLVPLPRYIRVKPSKGVQLEQILESLCIEPENIVKIDQDFYALPQETKLNSSSVYQKSLVYGMDFSSAIPPRCLQVDSQKQTRVLELGSAPGNKVMYIADKYPKTEIIGVEINANRANIMRNLVKKYGLQKQIQVVVEDGLMYQSQELFDRVLVDVECTHEGSVKHLRKFAPQKNCDFGKSQKKIRKKLSKQQQKQFELNNSNPYTSQITKANQWSFEDFKQRFLDEKKLSNLQSIQSGLLQNGFRLLKQGGILVYSTCSFDQRQNEDIVEKFLNSHQNAYLMDCSENLQCAVQYTKGRIPQTIKFSPSVSMCGGMFIAKIGKKSEKKQGQQRQNKDQKDI